MAYGKVEICGVDTTKLPVLSQARMLELFPLVHAGDKAARDEFVQGNLRLVLSVIQRFDKRGESPDDLFQVGCVGLLKAIANFDPDKNVRFSTYGVPIPYVFRRTERIYLWQERTDRLHIGQMK